MHGRLVGGMRCSMHRGKEIRCSTRCLRAIGMRQRRHRRVEQSRSSMRQTMSRTVGLVTCLVVTCVHDPSLHHTVIRPHPSHGPALVVCTWAQTQHTSTCRGPISAPPLITHCPGSESYSHSLCSRASRPSSQHDTNQSCSHGACSAASSPSSSPLPSSSYHASS